MNIKNIICCVIVCIFIIIILSIILTIRKSIRRNRQDITIHYDYNETETVLANENTNYKTSNDELLRLIEDYNKNNKPEGRK